ncbi:NADPH dehydrogenase [Desulfonema limicola]|uniref:NADPH dehydrogenase n=1 Tax=Desulfonema limicola TaxID=45656 RepID=A0A975BAP5_9BACT|nr:NAD(P)/FAD-dependent oxidoreductase [Desulfonema limicola]QTA81873.1 NADPH dehydrogenase [Desulfonema limicola]
MKDPLFLPITINNLEIKNRIYMPAMHMNMVSEFEITDRLVDFYAERAKGGAGFICVGYATVNDLAGTTLNIGAHKDEFIPGLSRLASAIKNEGARAAVQLNHAGRYNFSFFINGKQPVAPSPIPSRMTGETPKELEPGEIKQIIDDFAQAALRVKKAGYDAVEILSGTGYLISEFLSPLTNRRTDSYGGSLENRMRFGLEIVQAVKNAAGKDFPLIVRMNGNDFMPGGQGREELREYARALENAGADALCINVGWHEARVPQIISSVPRGVFAYLARSIKELVNIPVIASHRINDPQTARELISNDMCDMAAMGRSLIADPQLPAKTQAGKENEIIHCIACAQGCFDNIFKLKPVECLCNPKAGHEAERIEKTGKPKKVMVIGGGPAGMSVALAAFEKGHDVTLYEKTARLGGQLYLAAAPPGREEFAELAKDLSTQLAVKRIKTVFNTDVNAELIEAQKPDAVILATGAEYLTPPIPGKDLPHVVQAWDVLTNKAHTGRKVVIIGGGAVGVETALFLAEKGTLSGDALKFLFINKAESIETLYELASKGTKEIILVEMIDKIGKDIGKSTRWAMLQDMKRSSITSLTTAKALEINETGVVIESEKGREHIQADTIVLAAGSKPYNPLEPVLKQKNIKYQVIGDAGKIGRAFEAVHQGYAAGRAV